MDTISIRHERSFLYVFFPFAYAHNQSRREIIRIEEKEGLKNYSARANNYCEAANLQLYKNFQRRTRAACESPFSSHRRVFFSRLTTRLSKYFLDCTTVINVIIAFRCPKYIVKTCTYNS